MPSDWMSPFVKAQMDRYESLEALTLTRNRAGIVILSHIQVSESERGNGIGNQIMRSLLELADAHGDTVALTPSNQFGRNVRRLKSWYRSFGFRPNTGRRRDCSTWEAMIRPPQS
ncbi:GNAT superfamily N-acetyltransferase [Thalassobacillus pellis]|nr:GNAT superfamily N-acetyltransferase [Thalassobacillus pellis]